MTMHLERGLTTTSTKKREEKLTKAKLAELEQGWRERNARLKQMRLPKETFEQYLEFVYGKSKKTKGQEVKNPKSPSSASTSSIRAKQKDSMVHISTAEDKVSQSSRLWVTGACTTKPSPVYTGTKVVGIATMHKSNAVPIFSDDEAKEVSSMRR